MAATGERVKQSCTVILSEAKDLRSSFRSNDIRITAGMLRDVLLKITPRLVIPAQAGIHRCPGPQWVPAFAGTTAYVTFISEGGPHAYAHSA